MELKGKHIGAAICGSFCTFEQSEKEILNLLRAGAFVYPIFSRNIQTIQSRFGDPQEWISRLTNMTGNQPILTIEEAEPIGPKNFLDLLLISPCTGNTLAKLAAGITDTPVLMAAKAHLRNEKPVVISLSTNDALGASLKNIGQLMNTKHIYFVPFGQDNPQAKPRSMSARTQLIPQTIMEALDHKQIQPVIL